MTDSDGGDATIEAWGSEPLCSVNHEIGFSLNSGILDELRWYTYLSPDHLDDETLLESRNDD